MRAEALAAAIGAQRIGPDAELGRVAALAEAGANDLAGLFSRRWRRAARHTRAAAVVVTPSLAPELPSGLTRLVTEDARGAWARAIRLLHPGPVLAPPPLGIDTRAAVDPGAEVHHEARIGPFVTVGPGAVIGRGAALFAGAYVGACARVGAESTLHPRAAVLDGCTVGERVLLAAGAVVGSPGFGLDAEGRVPHVGVAIVEDDVSLGAHTCVDRGTVAETRICRGAHLDNLVQVGHNAYVGPGAVLCAQVGLCGGARVEAGVVLGGQAAVNNQVTVGAGARLAARSGVTRDLRGGADYSGFPAEPNRARLRRIVRLRRLVDR